MGGFQFVGRVVSNRMQKTVVVAVDQVVWQPKQKMYLRRTSKHFAHDEDQACDIGDVVKITWTQRMSKHKHYKVEQILKKMDVYSADKGTAAAQAASEAKAQEADRIQLRHAELQEAKLRLEKLREMYSKELGVSVGSSGGSG